MHLTSTLSRALPNTALLKSRLSARISFRRSTYSSEVIGDGPVSFRGGSFSPRLLYCVVRRTTNRDLLCDRASSWSSLNNKGCYTRRHFPNGEAGNFRIEEFHVPVTFRHLKLGDDWGWEFFAHRCPKVFKGGRLCLRHVYNKAVMRLHQLILEHTVKTKKAP